MTTLILLYLDLHILYSTLKNKLNAGNKGFDEIFANIEFDDSNDEFDMDVRNINKPSDTDSIFSELVNAGKKDATTGFKNVVVKGNNSEY